MSPDAARHSYFVSAVTNGNGASTITTKQRHIEFDSSPTQGDELPGPADLLAAALAACVLKNVERFGVTLQFAWRSARIVVEAERRDAPPRIIRMSYRLEIDTDEDDHRVDLLHRNIRKYGTISNTLAAACDLTGEIVAIRSMTDAGDRAQLPDGLEHTRTTDVFDETTAPAGLLRAHRVADGVWGRLVVHSGALRFVFEDDPDAAIRVVAGDAVVIPPARLHHIELDGPVTFAVEFHRERARTPPTAGHESTGLEEA